MHAAKKENVVGCCGMGGEICFFVTGVECDHVKVACKKGEKSVGKTVFDDQKRWAFGLIGDLKCTAVAPEKHAVAVVRV